MTEQSNRPQWWAESAAVKNSLDLPAYDPPRFRDGVYIHEVVNPLEEAHDCDILVGALNPHYPDDWQVWIDREPAFTIGRHRDANGNTVYEMTADQFRDAVIDVVE